METMESIHDAQLQELIARSVRLPKKGSFEVLLSQQLAAAATAKPLDKIRLICEAAYIVKDRNNINMNWEAVEAVYRVCISLQNVAGKNGVYVGWAFPQTKEVYARYIKPWLPANVPLTFTWQTLAERERKTKELEEAGEEERFWLLTSALGLTEGSLQVLRSLFIVWAMPQVATVFYQLARLITPETFLAVLKTKEAGGKNAENENLLD